MTERDREAVAKAGGVIAFREGASRFVIGMVPWLAIVLVWYGIHISGAINPALVPAPHSVASRLWALLSGGRLAGDAMVR